MDVLPGDGISGNRSSDGGGGDGDGDNDGGNGDGDGARLPVLELDEGALYFRALYSSELVGYYRSTQ